MSCCPNSGYADGNLVIGEDVGSDEDIFSSLEVDSASKYRIMNGMKLLILPKFHCELNLIEMI